MANSESVDPRTCALGVRHALLVFVSPGRLFARVEDTGAYGWTLITLLGLIMLIGYAQVKTGLIDRVVDQRTEQRLAAIEKEQGELVDRVALRERMDDVRKAATFDKLIARLLVIVYAPAQMLASCLLIASILYAVVALTGRKPEYHTLMSICVYSGFIVLAGYVVQLGMHLHYRTTNVDTSLGGLAMLIVPERFASAWDVARLAQRALFGVFSALDPFRIWFWVLVAMGLIVTRQLRVVLSVVSCTLMALVAVGVRVVMALGTVVA